MSRIWLIATFSLVALFGFAENWRLQLPRQFSVNQRWLAATTVFDVETPESSLGTVHRRILSLTPQYDFYDVDGILQATAKARLWAVGSVFDVTDSSGNPLGCIQERYLNFFDTFELLSSTGELLAIAEINLLKTNYSVKDPASSQEIASLSRPLFRLRDNWTVNVLNPVLLQRKGIDPRFFIIVMAFQTDRDWQRSQHQN